MTDVFLEERIRGTARDGFTEFSQGAIDDSALTFFYLPEIKTLTLSFFGESKAFRWPDIAPSATTLRSLSLLNSYCKEETLAALLSRTPNLRSLCYDYHIDTRPIHQPDKIVQCTGSKIGDAIRQVSGSLKNLDISICFVSRKRGTKIEGGHCRVPTSIGSLLHMTRLESMKINASLLFGWNNKHTPDLSDILPVNLRDLTISLARHIGYKDLRYPWSEKHLLEIFGSFLPQCRKYTPSLRRLVVDGFSGEASSSRILVSVETGSESVVKQSKVKISDREKLSEMCKRAGVACEIMLE